MKGALIHCNQCVRQAELKKEKAVAIYHNHIKVISRADGRSATASSAYRHGIKIKDDRTGLIFDYSKKQNVSDSVMLYPDHCPDFIRVMTRPKFWNLVEMGEKRKDAQVAREVEVSLMDELTNNQNKALCEKYVKSDFVGAGMIADVAYHNLGKANPHAHIMLTMREVQSDGFAKLKKRSWNKKNLVPGWRKNWEVHANISLAEAGCDARISCLSLKDQGIKRAPQIHIGPTATAMEKKGLLTDRRLEADRRKREYEKEYERELDHRQLVVERFDLEIEIQRLEAERAFLKTYIEPEFSGLANQDSRKKVIDKFDLQVGLDRIQAREAQAPKPKMVTDEQMAELDRFRNPNIFEGLKGNPTLSLDDRLARIADIKEYDPSWHDRATNQRLYFILYKRNVEREIIEDFLVWENENGRFLKNEDRDYHIWDKGDKLILRKAETTDLSQAVRLMLEIAVDKGWDLRDIGDNATGSAQFLVEVKIQVAERLEVRQKPRKSKPSARG